MAVQEDEKLFLVLNLLAEPDEQYSAQLIAAGYWDEKQNPTPQAVEFIRKFTDSKLDAVFQAVAKKGSYFKDKGYVLLAAGLKSTLSAEIILDELVKQEKLKKKNEHGYIVRCGKNH
ncbi:MAG: hypothetical protein RBT41_11060 [Clostridia bacterium]|jgi:hypothetical protein|nr:hypothetical protein [Clostridia bacterium]